MKGFSKTVVIVGLLVIVYAAFSRFYGEPSVALMRFKSSNILVIGNTLLVLSLVLRDWNK